MPDGDIFVKAWCGIFFCGGWCGCVVLVCMYGDVEALQMMVKIRNYGRKDVKFTYFVVEERKNYVF